MLVPALVICVGVVLLVPLSPCLIFGIGPFPALGIAGGGAALVLFYAARHGGAGLVHRCPGAMLVRFGRVASALGAVPRASCGSARSASVTSLQTNLTVALTTALVGDAAGPEAVAGYGTGARLEYLLVPLVFGLGAPLVAMVGTNIGAGQRARALRVAWIGAAMAFALTEAIGLAAALSPTPGSACSAAIRAMLAAGAAYLRMVGPAYGFFGLGLALYFASQGAGRLLWPLIAGLLRMLVAVGGGWLALRAHRSLAWLFAALRVRIAGLRRHHRRRSRRRRLVPPPSIRHHARPSGPSPLAHSPLAHTPLAHPSAAA